MPWLLSTGQMLLLQREGSASLRCPAQLKFGDRRLRFDLFRRQRRAALQKALNRDFHVRRYFAWRELIAVLASLVTLAHGVAVLCPGFVPYLPANRLANPLLFVRLIGGEMQMFLGAFNRVRRPALIHPGDGTFGLTLLVCSFLGCSFAGYVRFAIRL